MLAGGGVAMECLFEDRWWTLGLLARGGKSRLSQHGDHLGSFCQNPDNENRRGSILGKLSLYSACETLNGGENTKRCLGQPFPTSGEVGGAESWHLGSPETRRLERQFRPS